MSEYTKGMLSIPSLILIVGAVALVVVLFILLVVVLFGSVEWIGPRKMFDKDGNVRLRYTSNRTSLATSTLVADEAWSLLWIGGFGFYLTRTNRGGFHRSTAEQDQLARALNRTISDDYRKWLEQFDEQGNLIASEGEQQ